MDVVQRYAYAPGSDRYLLPPGVEEVRPDADTAAFLPEVVASFGYQRVFLVSSRTLNRRTDVVHRMGEALGSKLVGMTDKTGEHAPLRNVMAASAMARQVGADVLVAVGGGSVIDFAKFVQLTLTEELQSPTEFVEFTRDMGRGASWSPAIRQVAIPTTLSTSEWTGAGTPLDESTGQKVFSYVPLGAPQAIIYDPKLLLHTPRHLLLSTGIRGLDHAINTALSTSGSEFGATLALNAISLYARNLPALRDEAPATSALAECQKATWYTGMGQMSAAHGFSHFMVHLLAPWAGVSHGDAACVMMLAQARWFSASQDERLQGVARAMGRPEASLDRIVEDLLIELGMPRTLRDLGVDARRLDELITPALAHPFLTRFNLRPIETAEDLAEVFGTVA